MYFDPNFSAAAIEVIVMAKLNVGLSVEGNESITANDEVRMPLNGLQLVVILLSLKC